MAPLSALLPTRFAFLLDSILADFLLAFVFFTALCFAVLSRRFERQRAAGAIAVTLGLALAIGLVWWEHDQGFSLRDLGPIAAGFALLVLGFVMFDAFRRLGGHWAGAALALGAALLVGPLLPVGWLVDIARLKLLAAVAITVGIIALLLHRRARFSARAPTQYEAAVVRHDLDDLYRDRRAAKRVSRGLERIRHDASDLYRRPDRAGDVMVQLRRILPEEGQLTARLAELRRKAHFMRRGHIVRIDQLWQVIDKLPAKARHSASRALADRYQELRLNVRMERLDQAVAENERRVRELTRQAQAWLEAGDYRQLSTVLDRATELQRHNVKLLGLVQRTEAKLLATARQVAKEIQTVTAQ